MSALDSIAQQRLDKYLEAEDAILRGQKYKIGDREMTRADLGFIQKGIDYWAKKVDTKNAGGMRFRRQVPPG